LAAELAQHPPDVLFVPAHVLPLFCPVPAVVTVHDLGYRYYPEAHRPFDRWYLEWTTRRHARLARHIVADSQATRQDLLDFYGANPDKISVVYLGRDENLTRVNNPALLVEVKVRYQLEGDYLLYMGTLHPRKNLVRLVEAFHQAIQAAPQPNLKLVIAGKQGWLYHDIYRRVQQLNLSERVILPGYVAAEDKAALLSGALAYVFPSLYEGFGLPVLEAMACGVPVLTSNVSSLPEVGGTAALLVNPHDTEEIAAGLVRLISEAELRQELVSKGYQQIQKFTWQTAARQILQILEQICQPSPPP
jgi:glycosyltransferase involved in cell wall biosynthesis